MACLMLGSVLHTTYNINIINNNSNNNNNNNKDINDDGAMHRIAAPMNQIAAGAIAVRGACSFCSGKSATSDNAM